MMQTLALPTVKDIQAEMCKRSLHTFVKMSWHVLYPDEPFVDNWHIQAICMYLEACYDGKIRDLIINIPPGHMKSLLVNVFFPAWVWTKSPSKKFIFTSYSEDLVARDSDKCKKIIQSQWYQERFSVKLASTPDTATKFATTRGGYRLSYGFGGAVTGNHADFVCVDDPLKATEADSDAVRNKANKDYDEAISNRAFPITGCHIVIMQRLHERDLTGYLIGNKLGYELLVLPAEYEDVRFESSLGFVDPRTVEGELLWSERFNTEWIAKEKLKSTRFIAGQLQQRPAPAGGFVFQKHWFPRVHENDNVWGTFISWDTAESEKADAAFSCAIVGELRTDYSLFIKEVVRKRLLFPQLQNEIEDLATKYRRNLKMIVIENKSSGTQAIQSLQQSSPEWLASLIFGYNPKGKKEARAYQGATYCEKGCVLLPHPSAQYPWLPDFEDELFMFPSSSFKDQVDSFSQLLIYLRNYLSDGWRARSGNILTAMPDLNGVL